MFGNKNAKIAILHNTLTGHNKLYIVRIDHLGKDSKSYAALGRQIVRN